jgi:hypothetical protein
MYGLAVSGSVWGCEGMSRVYLGQDRGVREWAGCILVRIWV